MQRIYDAAVSPGDWAPALNSTATAVGGLCGFLMAGNQPGRRIDLSVGVMANPGLLARFSSALETGPLPPWIETMAVGQARRISDMQSESDYARSEFYNEIVRPQDAFYGAFAQLESTSNQRSIIAFGRTRQARDFADGGVAAFQAVVPHLINALRLRQRLGEADLRAADADAVLDRIDLGVILVDDQARPVRLNSAAEAIVARSDGLSAGPAGLAAGRADETRRLRRAIAMAAAAGTGPTSTDAAVRAATAAARLQVSRPSGLRPLILTVIPIRNLSTSRQQGRVQRAAVFVADPNRTLDTPVGVLRELFGLTAAEAALAIEVGQGDGLQAVADRLSIATTTARTHLTRVFEKTGTNRQAELVRLLASCHQPALRGD
ncbi:helix-turn-helix transcriptional regulator [Inquilinus sp. Marseille-Q2685]|uniref:helix-turn-helix transcriptional regulator n=1 Tax=Inquilinus sp. Marseille-Q2685 TaxID=2866581 RepID=UPI001CE3C7B3|nr:helix-turn-helix transcriptional regulator [Inquilinus sp. Marseille-Q2685]